MKKVFQSNVFLYLTLFSVRRYAFEYLYNRKGSNDKNVNEIIIELRAKEKEVWFSLSFFK